MTQALRFDVTPFLSQDEGQHFDRKSLFEGTPGSKRPRDRKVVRDQVAEYVAAFANAEGGVLILGLEDDGTPTGHGYPEQALKALLETPRSRLQPPQPEGFVVEHRGIPLVVFDVPASDVPVQVHGDGFPLRVGDRTVQATESQVQALKFQGLAQSWEARPSVSKLKNLDKTLLARAKVGAGLQALSDEEYLLKRKLADRRGRDLVLRQAAEILFAADGPEHPNAGIRIFRVIGTERRYGPEHNVEERPRIEGNLPTVLQSAFETIENLLRRPSRLVGTRFREVPEYPDFSWKEAVLNAVAHRDYSMQGRGVEVWLFEDRLEVSSPGELLPEVSIDDLLALKRVHLSRNPRLVRGLVDLGFMRDQGEGIPRIFAEMEGLFLPAPSLESEAHSFRLVLRNTPTLTVADRNFVAALGNVELSDIEFRALLEAFRRGRIDNARLREMSGLDTLKASSVLRNLRDRGLLEVHGAGSATYYELGARAASDRPELPPDAGDSRPDRPELDTDRPELHADRPELDADRPELDTDPSDLPSDLHEAIRSLGTRPRRSELRNVIESLCAWRALRPVELGSLLGIRPDNLTKRHLSSMVNDGILERIFPDNPNHPDQAYRARQLRLRSSRKVPHDR